MKIPVKRLLSILSVLLALTAFGQRSNASESPRPLLDERVDLHAHLFFHEGVGLDWFGSFDGPIRATSWRDRIRSKVNADALERSKQRVVAVALYSHPLFLGSQREAIRRQIAAAKSFVASHSDWIIARSASEARDAYHAGKRILIFTLEGADGILETEEDLKEFVDQEGVRIVTPFHFINDQYGGAALMPGIAGLVAPIAWLRSFWSPRDPDGIRLNPKGLTPKGRALIQSLLGRGVWIDFAHASDADYEGMLPMTKEAGQPLLYTHTMLRSVYQAERGISKAQLAQVRQTHGIVGLIPSEDIVGDTHDSSILCERGIPALASQFVEVAEAIGPSSVSLGTDINAPLNFLPSDCGQDTLGERGYFEYGQLGLIWKALGRHGAISAQYPGLKALDFIELWSTVKPDGSL